MSLLMDALKKAEMAKRQGRADGEGVPVELEPLPGLSLEPLPASPPPELPQASTNDGAKPSTPQAQAPSDLPNLPSHLEALDAQFLEEAQMLASAKSSRAPLPKVEPVPVQRPASEDATSAKAAPAPRTAQSDVKDFKAQMEQAAVQNVFAAKQPDKPASNKMFGIVVGLIGLVAAAGIGGYFWWQLQPKSSLMAASNPAAVRPAPPTPAPLPISPPAVASSAPATAAVLASAGATEGNDDEEDEPVPAKSKPANARVAQEPEMESMVRLTRTPLKINPSLARGFEAFGRGDYALAQAEYERVLKSEPQNTDALHGLAAIATRQGKTEQAEWLYQRVLDADPRDAVALSNLINSKAQVDPIAAESRLKLITSEQPDLAAPNFSLGNLYARQGRWNEAQQAYFRAYSSEPDNADIAYNLAISLEHLKQNKLASQYYALAIAAAKKNSGAFDPENAAARLRALQQ